MDSCAHWPQGIGDSRAGEKKPRPGKEHALNCPRCNSTYTKFCYYNNYSLSQPRYLCKACRRYWTQGGSLRNVPVGGGKRRSRKSSSSSSSSSTSSTKNRPCVGVVNLVPENLSAQIQNQNPRMMIHHDGHDLNLACNSDQYSTMGMPEFVNFGDQNPSFAAAVHQIPARELLKAGSFVVPSMVYESEGGGLLAFKQGPGFSGDRINGMINGFGHSPAGVEDHHRHHANSAATDLFFPFGDHVMMKEAAATGDPPLVHGKGETGGFWSGMLAGGSSR